MTQPISPTPMLTLWYKPSQTLQGLITSGGGQTTAVVVAGLFGMVQALPSFSAGGGLIPLFGGLFTGVLVLYLFGWLLRNFGRWFGSEAALADVRMSFGWGLLPWTVSFGFLFFFLASVGGDARQTFPLFFIVLVYGFVVLLLSLSASLGISFIKTFLCFVLTFLVTVFPLTLIAQLFFGLSPTITP
ncbi:MAG: hypothetical protein AAF065_08820 [Verrucomicrobiota bacterium]